MGHDPVISKRGANKLKRVAVITGARAEYGALRTTMEAIRAHPRLQLQVVATGMHLLRKFGRTVDEIAADGFRIDARVPMQSGSDASTDQATGLGRGIAGMARSFDRAHTDIVVVLGDRIEALAGALAAVTTGRMLAHIHGGDAAAGDFDDSLRHAITKLAHVHLAATRRSARRIVRMGEEAERVHVTGGPGLDQLRMMIDGHPRSTGKSQAAIVLFHAYGRSPAVEEKAATNVLRAAADEHLKRVVIYPNSDRGHRGVIHAIERHQRECAPDEVETHRSLGREEYVRRLMLADVLVGNSSSGIIEAPFLGTPSVDVGGRQAGREPGGRSVLHCSERRDDIRGAIRNALRLRPRRGGKTVYGDGKTGPRIARVLAKTPLTAEFKRKQISY